MAKKAKAVEEVETKLVEVAKEAKSKYPGFIKWVVGIIVAILMTAIGFFGGIFGLSAEKQDNLKKMITGSAMYQEMTSEAVSATAEKKDSQKEETKTEEKVEEKK